jgi:hypothetical protein
MENVFSMQKHKSTMGERRTSRSIQFRFRAHICRIVLLERANARLMLILAPVDGILSVTALLQEESTLDIPSPAACWSSWRWYMPSTSTTLPEPDRPAPV